MEPFLKWAGGKRWLISKSDGLFPPSEQIESYIEPFLGGAAIFFHLEPQGGILSDLNSELITTYSVVRDNWRGLSEILSQYHALHSKDFYYSMRENTTTDPIETAARFLYLNRTCWNGLYRVNKKGNFNVPIGTKRNVILESDNFQRLSEVLENMDIRNCDFEETINLSQNGDFLFVDPPYTVKHNLNGFRKYNETIFSWDDQIRLRDAVERAIQRGTKVLILNANHQSIHDLYANIGEKKILSRASVIAGSAQARGTYSEVAIKCW